MGKAFVKKKHMVYTIVSGGYKYGPMNRLQARDMIKQLGSNIVVYCNGVPVTACACGYLGGAIRKNGSRNSFDHSLTGQCDLCTELRGPVSQRVS